MIERRFQVEIERNNVADTYLFVGGSASRLQEVALKCASALLDCKGDILKHADIEIFDPAELGVDGLRVEHVSQRHDKVRSIETALKYRPVGGGFRAIVVYAADQMTTDAMGALLKTTEEPPDKTVLFFTATDLAAFTPAFISRCRIWRLEQTSEADAKRLAASAGLSDQQYERLLQVFGNRDVVLELDVKQRQKVFELVERFDNWLGGQADGYDLFRFEEGTRHAQKRTQGIHDLSIVRSLLASIELDDNFINTQALLLDAVDEAIKMLDAQINPDLVWQNISKKWFALNLAPATS
ncbi:MAG: hypothetical protein QGF46_08755 [Planctomycetota bacterium]|jgi:hypothetical protein|nr:hypothetical protein [Planctomycetota bacterium]